MRLLPCSLVLLLSAGFACAQSATPADEKQLMALEEAFVKSIASQDAASLSLVEKHMPDTIITVGPFGALDYQSRQDMMSDLRKPEAGVTMAYKQSDYKMNVDGDTAVVTYKAHATVAGKKNAAMNTKDLTSNCMDVFIKRKGEWLGWATTCTPTRSVPQATYDAVAEMQKR